LRRGGGFDAPGFRIEVMGGRGLEGRTRRRFEDVNEVYFFSFEGGRISAVWGVEDTLDRFRQLGLDPGRP
jgi:hypothetical protein